MPRVLKFFALLLVNVVVALIASAIVESAIDRLIPTHSIAGVVQKQWALSIVCAALLGVGMYTLAAPYTLSPIVIDLLSRPSYHPARNYSDNARTAPRGVLPT